MGPVSLVMRSLLAVCWLSFFLRDSEFASGFVVGRRLAAVGCGVSRGLDLLLFGRRHPRRYLLLSRPSRSLLRGTSGVQPRDSEQ